MEAKLTRIVMTEIVIRVNAQELDLLQKLFRRDISIPEMMQKENDITPQERDKLIHLMVSLSGHLYVQKRE